MHWSQASYTMAKLLFADNAVTNPCNFHAAAAAAADDDVVVTNPCNFHDDDDDDNDDHAKMTTTSARSVANFVVITTFPF